MKIDFLNATRKIFYNEYHARRRVLIEKYLPSQKRDKAFSDFVLGKDEHGNAVVFQKTRKKRKTNK